MEALAARGDWEVTVVNPIGLPPVKLARYADIAETPLIETGGPVTVHHPRFTLIPGLSGHINPLLIARAILPLVRRLHAEQPFDMVDAQFFYPDGPAAMRVAEALGLPFAIKARGSDIHYWGTSPSRCGRCARPPKRHRSCCRSRRHSPATWPPWACQPARCTSIILASITRFSPLPRRRAAAGLGHSRSRHLVGR
jgi:hypothetical protein